MRAWADLLGRAAQDRTIVLALHPGTRDAMAAGDIPLARGVRVVQPQGYRTSIALQLHAAAVVTDSGGVQREAGWLRTPCLIIRDETEWVEAVADSERRMVVVGLDVERALAELERLAPPDIAPAFAAARASSIDVRPSGAAAAISAMLEKTP
jgi:UDP-GlcNAc3NAcA epimerase